MAEMTHWGLQMSRVKIRDTMSSPFPSIKLFKRIKKRSKGEPVLVTFQVNITPYYPV